jgi:cytochrome c-type biogenesis protein CcmH
MKALTAVAVVLVLMAPAAAGAARTSLPDIEDEVMCVQCGTALNLSTSAVADRERAFIRREIARGKTKEEIKDALVASFGPKVLALPDDTGFGLASWLVPVLASLLALVAVAAAARHWRRQPRPPKAQADLDQADASRLEEELAAYDDKR